jgi:adenylate kinase
MRIILLGAPGSGKGTLSNILIEKKGYVQISTGDLFREQVQLGTELGKKVESIMKAGEFVPVEITNKILENKLAELKHNDNIIFDGYPRNIEQANYLSTLTNIDKVIEIQVSDDILLKRIVGR